MFDCPWLVVTEVEISEQVRDYVRYAIMLRSWQIPTSPLLLPPMLRRTCIDAHNIAKYKYELMISTF